MNMIRSVCIPSAFTALLLVLSTRPVHGQAPQPPQQLQAAQPEKKAAKEPSEPPAQKPTGKPTAPPTQPKLPAGLARPGSKQPSAKPTAKPGKPKLEKPSVATQPKPVYALALPPDFPGAGLFNNQPPFLVGVKLFAEDLTYREGDVLRVKFTAERESHLYLIYHQADGTSLLLFPNEARTDSKVPAKQDVLVPDLGDPFRFQIGPPLGIEVFQVLASLKPIEELDSLVKQKTGRAVVVSRELIGKLRDQLLKGKSSWTEHRVPIRTIAKDAVTADRKPARVGLFIGIDQYQNTKLCKPHEELRKGAELMHKTFLDRGGLDPSRTKLITGEQATKANIEEAITKWLPSVSAPGDTVFIFHTGHGGTVKNLDGTEPDGLNELLWTYDNDVGTNISSQEDFDIRKRATAIMDETLARWLQELPGRQIVLMVDSCYGGGVVDASALPHFFDREAARVKDISQLNVVVMTGSGPDETVRTPKGKVSWMPRLVAEAMETLPRPVTIRQAYSHYRQGIQRWLKEIKELGLQEPVLVDSVLIPIVLAP